VPRLRRSFFERRTQVVARRLLGCSLVRVLEGKRLVGRIVETEAYRGARDPASHAYRGMTSRNALMFGKPGRAYVYFVYGFHNCLNVTTEPVGTPGAVLIRAIEPVEGEAEMMKNRRVGSGAHLTDGPGRLTQALRIDRGMNGEDLVGSGRLFIEGGSPTAKVASGPRVGVSGGKRYPWRFYLIGNRFVSAQRGTRPRRIHN
jgi:DNA-3-methyladenine glycosylase